MGSTGSPRQGPRDNSHHLVQQGGQPPQRLPFLAIVLFFLSALLRQQRRADDACAVAERTELDARVTHGIA